MSASLRKRTLRSKPTREKNGRASHLWSDARKESRRIKRTAILQAAAAALHEKGYHGTSLSDIAALLGMTDGALYYYFKNKADLASACILASYEQAGVWLEQAEGDSGLKKINYFIAKVSSAMAEKKIWIPAVEPFWLTAALRKDIQKAAAANLTRLAALVRQGVGDKSMRWCEPVSTAAFIAGTLFLARSWAPYAGYAGSSPEKLTAAAANFISESLAAPPVSGERDGNPLS